MNRPAISAAPFQPAPVKPVPVTLARRTGTMAALSIAVLLGACAGNPLTATDTPVADTSIAGAISNSQSELEKATLYWSKEYTKDTRNLPAALSYAKNLKAGGHKDRALTVLQDASIYHGSNRELASEYGRLALDMGQVSLAEKLLAAADDPAAPDWRVISARGTVESKQGKYAEAIPHYERALTIAPDASSVLNNLAMAYAANGRATEAEPLLRRAIEVDGSNAKLKQNLALVVGLQGRHDEAKQVDGQNLAQDAAKDNAEVIRQMVKTSPMPDAPTPTKVANAERSVKGKAGRKPTAPDLRQATADTAAEPNWDKLVSMAITNSTDGKPGKR
jgi:Flp pilus assembly protein TadD